MQIIKENHPTVEIKNIVFGEGQPKICLPVIDSHDEEILRTVERYEKLEGWDVLEVRLDYYDNLLMGGAPALLEKIREKTSRVILATIRTKSEGGEADIDDDRYGLALQSIITAQACDMVDIEENRAHSIVFALTELAQDNGIISVVSKHDFDKTPSNDDMREYLSTMQVLGGDILKLAVMPHDRNDVMRLMKVTTEMSLRLNRPLITMSMGDLGKISRIAGEMTGSVMTFGTAGDASAPGQIELGELTKILGDLHCD